MLVLILARGPWSILGYDVGTHEQPKLSMFESQRIVLVYVLGVYSFLSFHIKISVGAVYQSINWCNILKYQLVQYIRVSTDAVYQSISWYSILKYQLVEYKITVDAVY